MEARICYLHTLSAPLQRPHPLAQGEELLASIRVLVGDVLDEVPQSEDKEPSLVLFHGRGALRRYVALRGNSSSPSSSPTASSASGLVRSVPRGLRACRSFPLNTSLCSQRGGRSGGVLPVPGSVHYRDSGIR